MNLMFTSQCHKNALTETRRVLDQFAERKGDRTWQSSMTNEGQKTVRRLLRKTARKNTAVACHWVRGKNHSELLWIVGDRKQFNDVGTTPTNTTKRNILRANDENDWHSAEVIHLLSGTAALFHDLGKASDAFQDRLQGRAHEGRTVYRHEWVSVRLFEAFIAGRSDHEWLTQLLDPAAYDASHWITNVVRDDDATPFDAPFSRLPPLATTIAWLIVSHHRLPRKPPTQGVTAYYQADIRNLVGNIHASWNEIPTPHPREVVDRYWMFSKGLPVTSDLWKARAARFARRWLALLESGVTPSWLDDPYVMHLSRMALMLADHNVSATKSPFSHASSALFANTSRATGAMNQELTEHLLGVTREAGYITHGLADLSGALSTIARHKLLRKRADTARFRWQDKAADLAQSVRSRSEEYGAFFVNMASTGAGKTFANARIMYALADPQKGARFTVALGLRTLTQQTGVAYRTRLGLSEEELAIRVGGAASRVLFEYFQDKAEQSGSESSAEFLYDADHVMYEGDYEQNALLRRVVRNEKIRGLVDAPVLVCTIDHLMPATESQRGGHQIAPLLRLLTSDLVLDEVDDFGLEDLPAVARLVHWAGVFGSRVMLSSATLPPAIVEALFDAYRAGRQVFQTNRGRVGAPVNVPCAWFDEHRAVSVDCADIAELARAHRAFCEERVDALSKVPARRSAEIVDVSTVEGLTDNDATALADVLLDTALALHAAHGATDKETGRRVSFGLIRMANIEPLVQVAQALYAAPQRKGVRLHLCVYHSQFPQVARSHIEHVLDTVLYRGGEQDPCVSTYVRDALTTGEEVHHLFVVVASPVSEVGRDHDYDWAIVEPSSMRSIIQLAGRVRRHRLGAIETPNIALLSHNVRALSGREGPVFVRPGFEGTEAPFLLKSHDVRQLLRPDEVRHVDARPRVLERHNLDATQSLVDLEHARLRSLLFRSGGEDARATSAPKVRRRGGGPVPTSSAGVVASDWWEMPRAGLSYLMQRWKPFRLDTSERTRVVFIPNEDGVYELYEEFEDRTRQRVYTKVEDSKLRRMPDSALASEWVQPWANAPVEELLEAMTTDSEGSDERVAVRYAGADLVQREDGWQYHWRLGFFVGR